MEFKKYTHIERLGTIETEGILEGDCYIFPKIDGTNASIWMGDEYIECGSRRRKLTLTDDNRGFWQYVHQHSEFNDFFNKYPDLKLYGEWLVPHTIRQYEDFAWRNFYVFDVEKDGKYMSYDEYHPILQEMNITHIPLMAKIHNPTMEQLKNLLNLNSYLIDTNKTGDGIGEGIVIKNYDFINKDGDPCFAKIVRSEFHQRHNTVRKRAKSRNVNNELEVEIADTYCTEAFVRKEHAKIIDKNGGWSSKMIPQLLGTVYHEVINEDIWHIIKNYKNPTINFKELQRQIQNKTKERLPEVFA